MMRILLDSHTALWWMENPARLKEEARKAISDPTNQIYLSSVSVWELGLKRSKGKLKLPDNFTDLLKADGVDEIPFTHAHANRAVALPAIHGDPFDRALIAQCQLESLHFATRDQFAPVYQVAILPV
jgi:PIN domain nuclease of toxin-antitoxin system